MPELANDDARTGTGLINSEGGPLTPWQQVRVLKACRDIIDKLQGRARRIVVEILAEGKPVHSRVHARSIGVSHQRVGQVATTIANEIDKRVGATLAEAARKIDKWAGPLCEREAVAVCLTALFPATGDREAAGLARWCMGRLTVRTALRRCSVRIDVPAKTRRLQAAAKRLAVHGTVETGRLERAAGLEADDDIHLLNKLTGMTTHGRWTAVRRGTTGRIRVTLLNSGQPLTAEQISKQSGVSLKSTLITLRSQAWAKKVDSHRWGLEEWNMPGFRGLGRLAVELLEQAGGRMLRNELKRRLEAETGRSRGSIGTTLSAPRFKRTGRWIELTDSRGDGARNLGAEAHGMDARGNPYVIWQVPARRDLTRVHVESIGHALAAHAGCDTERTTRLRVIKPEGCDDVSLTRYLHRPGGTTLGRLKTVLERLEAKPDELLRVTMEPRRQVRIERAELGPSRGTSGAKQRRRTTSRPTRGSDKESCSDTGENQ